MNGQRGGAREQQMAPAGLNNWSNTVTSGCTAELLTIER